MSVPALRLHALNDAPLRPERALVVYWMTAARRASWNHGLDRAVEHARSLGKPLLVFEPLRAGHRFANDRIQRFVIEGMADNRAAFARVPVTYYPYVEPHHGDARGLLAALAAHAAVIVTDEYPCYFLPRMQAAAAARLDVRLERVDSCGLLPLAAHAVRDGRPHRLRRAVDFRRHLQRSLPSHLGDGPREHPLRDAALPRAPIPVEVLARWPAADLDRLLADGGLAALAIDHAVPPVPGVRGGSAAGRRVLDTFLAERLVDYDQGSRHPDAEGTSGLSPYLHFGHVGAHEVLAGVADVENWSLDDVTPRADGARTGWWHMSAPAEAFLDQLVTWRELGFQTCKLLPETYAAWESLPDWARATLEEHATDPRPQLYSREQLADARSDDEIWNAAARQLRDRGTIHTYLRMLWGKNVLAWTAHPREALDTLLELNDRFALDGRDPNSASGILWCFGRHDRAWGPERPIFGKVRYMTSSSTRRKLRLKGYLDTFGPGPTLFRN